jgi:predicted O-methyltransferase YrrM
MKQFESIFRGDFEKWINEKLVQKPSSIFLEMEEFAFKSKIPILSPVAGENLKFLVEVFQPSRILELGTGLGYSTAWMLASQLDLEIVTIDRNLEALNWAESFMKKLISNNQKVIYLKAHCLHYLREQENINSYDFIFVDCDKITYPEILEILVTKTSKNTKLVFDNVLWHGRLDPSLYTRPSDRAIQKFWEIVISKKLKRTLIPAGDGLLLIKL